MKRIALLAACLWLGATAARAEDTVMKLTGKDHARGKITAMSASEVTVERSSGPETVKLVDIDFIRFDDEPATLNSARSNIAEGRYENALKYLDKIAEKMPERAELQGEVLYLRGLAAARLAMERGDNDAIRDAGAAVLAFVEKNATHYRALPAAELLGDLYVAAGAFGKAKDAYSSLAKSEFPDFRMRGALAAGRAAVEQEKYDEAVAEFDKVVALAGASQDKIAVARKYAALLGKARCLARANQVDAALALVNEVLPALPPENKDLHAEAYLTLGACHRSQPAGRKNAIWAYLHVDLAYYSNPQAHAEALYYLSELWKQDGKPDRSDLAREMLTERYASSTWARR